MRGLITNMHFTDLLGERIDDLRHRVLPKLLRAQKTVDENRNICFTDGQIIGTGESDYTKGNACYEFAHQGKAFQLLDVPGIEGNESAHEKSIQEAITKAHLVFYINGTNKKPEAETASKIRRYMRREALVFAICNVRGKADSYEFAEDQISLERTHKGIEEVTIQTKELLVSLLGPRLTGVESIQGLLGFCSLAYTSNEVSTIHRSRERDLIKSQSSFVNSFYDPRRMRDYSRIDCIAELIKSKSATFEEDVIISNKQKIGGLIKETLSELATMLEESQQINDEIRKEVALCKKGMRNTLRRSVESITNSCKAAADSFFLEVENEIHDAVDKHYRSTKKIEACAKSIVERKHAALAADIESIQSTVLKDYNESITMHLERLQENVGKILVQNQIKVQLSQGIPLSEALDPLKLDIKAVGAAAFKIGGYVLVGMAAGSPIPGIGNAIGAAAGAIIGLLLSLLARFTSKKERIRETQRKVSEIIEQQRGIFMNEFNQSINDLATNMSECTERQEAELDAALSRIGDVAIALDSVIDQLGAVKRELEE